MRGPFSALRRRRRCPWKLACRTARCRHHRRMRRDLICKDKAVTVTAALLVLSKSTAVFPEVDAHDLPGRPPGPVA